MTPYEGYVYAYPHKTAYRPLDPRPALSEVWAGERAGALYVHIPFCEMRCGFCNLFTRTGAPEGLTGAYLDALERQARAVRAALDEPRFATAAFGGGTPTYLNARELTRLFDLTERAMDIDLREIPLSVETSPATATPERLAVLAERGASRISIGVQSFADAEARAAVRPQKRAEVDAALDAIRASGIAALNIDLIYGIDGQTPDSWHYSLDAALTWKPEELYLYPLYVRPLTGLGRQGRAWDDQRMELYRLGRDHLLDAGYEQVSMRMFRLPDTTPSTDYCCQTTAWSASAAGPGRTRAPCTTPSSTRSGPATCGRSSTITCGATTSAWPTWGSPWTRRSAGDGTSSSRCCGPRGCRGTSTGPGSAPTCSTTSPCWTASLAG